MSIPPPPQIPTNILNDAVKAVRSIIGNTTDPVSSALAQAGGDVAKAANDIVAGSAGDIAKGLLHMWCQVTDSQAVEGLGALAIDTTLPKKEGPGGPGL